MKIVKNRIAEARRKMKPPLSQRGLAKKMGINYSSISKWEAYDMGISDEMKVLLCDVLDKPFEWLFYIGNSNGRTEIEKRRKAAHQ